MCLAIFISKDSKLSKERLQRAFINNPDGGGFAYIEDGEINGQIQPLVKIQKGYAKFEELWDAFNIVQELNSGPKLVHVRRKSCGDIDALNCHPFRINAFNALIHNGTLHDFVDYKSKFSDTSRFVINIMRPMFEQYPSLDFCKSKFGQWLIEEAIGSFNKVVILNANGEHVIFNETAGHWFDGCWFSNCSYLPPPPPKKKTKFQKREKKLKPSYYRLPEGGVQLTKREISDLTHLHHTKLKHLVSRGIVIPVYYSPSENSTPASIKALTV